MRRFLLAPNLPSLLFGPTCSLSAPRWSPPKRRLPLKILRDSSVLPPQIEKRLLDCHATHRPACLRDDNIAGASFMICKKPDTGRSSVPEENRLLSADFAGRPRT